MSKEKNLQDYKGAYKGNFYFEFDAKTKDGSIPDTIHIIPMGEWMHDAYGPIKITNNDLREFMANFNAGIRKGVFITAGHEGYEELPAVGWMQELEMRDTGLWAKVEWNELGKSLLSDKAFKFFSPEFYRDYEDPQTHQIYRNVLTGGALTKSPYFKELEAVVFSDKNIKKTFNDTNTMDLTTVLAKDITTLTDEEKAFIVANKEQLTEEQKASHASVIEVVVETEAPEVAPVDTPVVETPATEDAPVVTEPAADAAPTEEVPATVETPAAEVTPEVAPVTASEKGGKMVTMSETEATELRQAFAALKANKLSTFINEMVYSEKNTEGKFLAKDTDNLRSFAEGLNDAQLASFKELVSKLPSLTLFKEYGAGEGAATTAVQQVESLTEKLMSEKSISYGEALKTVFAEDKALEARYNEEVNK